jgi:hypothetical protein
MIFILHMASFCQGRPTGAAEGGLKSLDKMPEPCAFHLLLWSLIFHHPLWIIAG